MDFGVVLQTDPPAWRVVELAVRAEECGFSHAWTFDSHILWQEPFVIHSQILSATKTLKVGTMVTNPATRDPTLTASCFATLNDMFGNRTVCGIGRGDSAVRVQGGRPTTLRTLEEAMRVIKGLASGEEVDYGEAKVRLPWAGASQLEVWMAGYGPKALELVGRAADGLILQLADEYLTEWSIKTVRAAAETAHRQSGALTMCVAAPAYVGDDLAHQRDQLRWFGGMVGNHVADLVARYGEHSQAVPEALTDYIKGREGYDYSHHGKAGNPSTEFVPDSIVDRFCVLGPAEAHVEKLRRLESLGADHFAMYLMHDAQEETLDAYRRVVIPALAGQ